MRTAKTIRYASCDDFVITARTLFKDKILRPSAAKNQRDSLIVHFRCEKDVNKFAQLIKAPIYADKAKVPIIYNPKSKVSAAKAKFHKAKNSVSQKKTNKTELDIAAEESWKGTVAFVNDAQPDFACPGSAPVGQILTLRNGGFLGHRSH